MSRQYDELSDLYERAKDLPVGLAERETLVAALPDLTGASILDVGTGTGYYARLFRRLGARRVVGVDASPMMIARAREGEERDDTAISYEVYDAADLPRLGEFDVVTAVWLLGYADGAESLDRMLAAIASNLSPSGTLVALVPNPDFDWYRTAEYPRYGLSIRPTVHSRGRQGSHVRISTEPPFDIEGWTWPWSAIEAALARAGLSGPGHRPVRVPADPPAGGDGDYWAELAANPTFAVFTACRENARVLGPARGGSERPERS